MLAAIKGAAETDKKRAAEIASVKNQLSNMSDVGGSLAV